MFLKIRFSIRNKNSLHSAHDIILNHIKSVLDLIFNILITNSDEIMSN